MRGSDVSVGRPRFRLDTTAGPIYIAAHTEPTRYVGVVTFLEDTVLLGLKSSVEINGVTRWSQPLNARVFPFGVRRGEMLDLVCDRGEFAFVYDDHGKLLSAY